MNIGLEVLNSYQTAVPSMESVFGQYIACEAAFSNTEKFAEYGDKLFEAFENLVSLRATAAKFQSTEGLAVLNDLVGQEFGGQVSVETIGEGAKSVWQKIKDFFKKIWEWIKYFFNRILNFFFGAEKRLGKLLGELKSMKGKIRPWKLPMPSNIPEMVEKAMKSIQPELKKLENCKDVTALKQVKSIIDKFTKTFEEYKLGNEVEITTVELSMTIVGAVLAATTIGKTIKTGMESATKAVNGLAAGLEKKGDIATAKAAVEALKSGTKLVNKACTVTSRLAAVVMTRCKPVAPDKAAKK